MPKYSVGESFTVALISGIKKVWIRKGEYHDFLSKLFFSHSAENFRRGIHCCVKFEDRKSLDRRGGGGGVSRYSVENFFSVRKIFVGESFTVAFISGIQKVWIRRGEYQEFLSKIFCLTVPTKFVGESFSNSINSGIEKC